MLATEWKEERQRDRFSRTLENMRDEYPETCLGKAWLAQSIDGPGTGRQAQAMETVRPVHCMERFACRRTAWYGQ